MVECLSCTKLLLETSVSAVRKIMSRNWCVCCSLPHQDWHCRCKSRRIDSFPRFCSANDAWIPEKITLPLSIWLIKMSQCGWRIEAKIVHQSILRNHYVLLVCCKRRCCCVQLQDPIGCFPNSLLSHQHSVLANPMGNSCLGKTVFWGAFDSES